MNSRNLLIITIFLSLYQIASAQTIVSYEKPGKEEFQKAVSVVLSKTECNYSDMEGRIQAMGIIQREFNNFAAEKWHDYRSQTDKKKIAKYEKKGALYFYTKAMDKILEELQTTVAKPGEIIMWNLYNMGYIVRTPSHTFSIDLVHKHIDKFAGYLEFNLITHNHRDHGSMNEFEAFAAAEVPVYAGYHRTEKPEALKWIYVEEGETITIDNIVIKADRVDHSRKPEGYKFVTSYEIDCGNDTGNTVIFHTGDGRNYEQMNPEKAVDFFIFHTAVGLDIQKAINKVQPKFAVFSHAWEMGHKAEKYRWTIDDLLNCAGMITGFPEDRILLPCWGEKITYSKQ